jgi:ABC-type transporter Mla MlaB component
MFRLTEHCGSGGIVLKLEGRCSSDIVEALESSWRAALRRRGSVPVWVDLSEVSRVDPAAQAQLARMHRDGARFVVRGCLMREVLREICDSR